MHSELVPPKMSASTKLSSRSTLELQDNIGLTVASVDCDRAMIGNSYHL